MDEQQLAEIEAIVKRGCPSHEIRDASISPIDVICTCFEDFEDTALALAAEIRRLRGDLEALRAALEESVRVVGATERVLHLSELSRGVPSSVGRD